MYALVHKERVLVGPMRWNRGLFEAALKKIGVEGHIPRLAPDADKLPIVYDADTKIMPARYETEPMNPKIERTYGPYWTFDNNIAVGLFKVKDKEIDSVKSELKNEAAEYRYELEIAGTTATIQDTEVTVDTTREGRNIFIQKHSMMADDDTVAWKFPEGWLTLTKTDLGAVITAGATHIQTQFDWEATKSAEIDAASDLATLDAIEIRPTEDPDIPE